MPLDVSEVALQFVLLFLPGITGTLLVHTLTFLDRPPGYLFSFYAVLFGLAAYVVYGLVVGALNQVLDSAVGIAFFDTLNTGVLQVRPSEIAGVTGTAMGLAILISIAVNRGVLHALALGAGVTRQFHEASLWGYMFNRMEGTWVTVRELDHDLAYEGWVAGYSDGVNPNELLLRNAQVFRNSTGDHLYDVPALFLSRSADRLALEFEPGPFPATLMEGDAPVPVND